jgi:Family of unknown function (DUF5681)
MDEDTGRGFGKAPKEFQFQAGKSGNPRGRPPGAFGVIAMLRRSLAAKGSDGKTALEQMIDAMVTQAQAGDHALAIKIIDIVTKHDEKMSDVEESPDEN